VSTSVPATRAEGQPGAVAAVGRRARSERAALKRALRAGRLTLGEVAARRPGPLRDMPLFALVGVLPGIGQRRLEHLNRRAIAARINLARTLGEASTTTLGWLLAELDGAEAQDLEFALAPPQVAEDETHDWRAVALALDRLIREHERSVCDESLPAERWVWADERLHNARAAVIGRLR
jgi:hypothetical protein